MMTQVCIQMTLIQFDTVGSTLLILPHISWKKGDSLRKGSSLRHQKNPHSASCGILTNDKCSISLAPNKSFRGLMNCRESPSSVSRAWKTGFVSTTMCLLGVYILLTSNLGLVGHTRQFQKPMSSGLIQHWHFLLRPMSSGHNHDIHRNIEICMRYSRKQRPQKHIVAPYVTTVSPGCQAVVSSII